METTINPVAWENAEITAYALIENPKNQNFIDYYLAFGSYLDKKHGEFSVSGGQTPKFKLGDKFYVLEEPTQPNLETLTKILYEVFYKHQS
ncbi:hypothetical protein [Acinetobacter sp.]|jgi:hypothetical protein|uniref:hypothetical protein n=1 Tax=Acinetobacter sp. TaxID=472 RepID=UPI0039825A37